MKETGGALHTSLNEDYLARIGFTPYSMNSIGRMGRLLDGIAKLRLDKTNAGHLHQRQWTGTVVRSAANGSLAGHEVEPVRRC